MLKPKHVTQNCLPGPENEPAPPPTGSALGVLPGAQVERIAPKRLDGGETPPSVLGGWHAEAPRVFLWLVSSKRVLEGHGESRNFSDRVGSGERHLF